MYKDLFTTDLKYIDTNKKFAFANFTEAFHRMVANCREGKSQEIVFLCIGTDRSTGDSLGPIIGYKLRGLKYDNVHVWGNLDNPVHAKNLQQTTDAIYEKYNDPLIVAIDACLGRSDHVGYITVGKGPIRPGSAVKKELEPVGHMHVTGVVNIGGVMDFLILQNTRLSMVMKIADIISSGIKYVLWQISREDMLRNLDSSDYLKMNPPR